MCLDYDSQVLRVLWMRTTEWRTGRRSIKKKYMNFCRTLTLKVMRTSFADFCTDVLSRIFSPVSWQIFYIYDTQISTENIYRILIKQSGHFWHRSFRFGSRYSQKCSLFSQKRIKCSRVLSPLPNIQQFSTVWCPLGFKNARTTAIRCKYHSNKNDENDENLTWRGPRGFGGPLKIYLCCYSAKSLISD